MWGAGHVSRAAAGRAGVMAVNYSAKEEADGHPAAGGGAQGGSGAPGGGGGTGGGTGGGGGGGGAVKSRKPDNTAFKQQRLPAWQPILTAGTVLPAFFVIGLIFIPIGIGIFVTSNNIREYEVRMYGVCVCGCVGAAPPYTPQLGCPAVTGSVCLNSLSLSSLTLQLWVLQP